MIRFRIISLQTGVILVFLLWLISLDLFEPHSNPTRYPLNQRILGARTCHMQLVNRVIDSCLKVVNLDSNHHQVLCAFLFPPILSSIYSSMISDFDVRYAQHFSPRDTCQAEHTIVSAEITMIFYIINDFVIFIVKFEIVILQFMHLYL